MARRRGGKRSASRAAPRWSVPVAAAIVLTVIGIGGWFLLRPARVAAPVPSLPDLTGQTMAIRQHLTERHAAATSSTAATGALCVALHADMFFTAAQACYAAVRQLEPTNWKWVYLQAIIEADMGGGGQLVADLQRVTQQDPSFGPAWLRLGDAAFKAGDYDMAAMAWGQAAALPDPPRDSDAPPHQPEAPLAAYASLGIARVALARGDQASARTILEEIVGNVPDFGPAWRLLADTDQPSSPAALHAIQVADHLPAFAPYADPVLDELARESRNSTFLLRLSSEANLGVNAPWSEFLARRALEFDPDNPDVISKLGRILRTLGRNEEALVYFRRYNALVPGDYQGLAHTGSCLSALGRYDEAEALLRRALPHLDDAMTHYNLGLLLAQTGRTQEAEQEYRAALERDPTHVDSRINLANTLARTGRRGAAIEELQRALATDPGNALARANLDAIRR